jgi:hypothetical protein
MTFHRRQLPRIRLNMNVDRHRTTTATAEDYAYVIGVNLLFCAVAAGGVAGFLYLLIG